MEWTRIADNKVIKVLFDKAASESIDHPVILAVELEDGTILEPTTTVEWTSREEK